MRLLLAAEWFNAASETAWAAVGASPQADALAFAFGGGNARLFASWEVAQRELKAEMGDVTQHWLEAPACKHSAGVSPYGRAPGVVLDPTWALTEEAGAYGWLRYIADGLLKPDPQPNAVFVVRLQRVVPLWFLML